MTDASIANAVDRYAAVNKVILTTYQQECLDFKYDKMIDTLKQTDWNSSASEGGMMPLLVTTISWSYVVGRQPAAEAEVTLDHRLICEPFYMLILISVRLNWHIPSVCLFVCLSAVNRRSLHFLA
jgi:hypothetical protein